MQDSQRLVNRFQIATPSPIQKVTHSVLQQVGIRLEVKRDDLLHPIISGNKWRKLQGHLQQMCSRPPSSCLSFGGGFSNHLHALGYCCHQLALPFTAIVRGDYSQQLTPMLHDLQNWGTHIQFVSKSTYSLRTQPEYLEALRFANPNANIIPEGGSDALALAGVASLLDEVPTLDQYDYLFCPVASGGTLAALAWGLAQRQSRCQVIGIAVLKGETYLQKLVGDLLPQGVSPPQILHNFHCGGYGKRPPELHHFCAEFSAQTNIPVEPIYSGKLFNAILTLAKNRHFKAGSRLLALHTGGLQGAR